MNIVAITSCAGGIAHTYMAAEALKRAAKAAGDQIKVEVQGSLGVENELLSSDIQNADFVLFAADIAIRNAERFQGKIIIEISPHEVIANGKVSLEKAKKAAAEKGVV